MPFSLRTSRWVSPVAPMLVDRWDASAHLGSYANESVWVRMLQRVGRAEEGARAEAKGLAWRPSNLVDGLVFPTTEQLQHSPPAHEKAVGPGDIVLSKFLPVRAGVVVDATPRLPADGNCIRLGGATLVDALWIVLLLTHAAFAPVVARLSGGAVLPRIGVRDLRSLSIPPPPGAVTAWVPGWWEAANALTEAERGIAELMSLAQGLADDSGAEVPDARLPAFVAPVLVQDTWVPEQVALARYRVALVSRGWFRLAPRLVTNPPRVRERLPAVRLLRLADANDTFGFTPPPVAETGENQFRVYAMPLQAGEVLLSTLGSASKLLINYPPAESTLWLSDQWVRLQSVADAGAMALLLTTTQVRWQLERAATGVVRQFVGRDELGEVLLPPISADAALDLHQRLWKLLHARAEAQKRLGVARAGVNVLIQHALTRAA